MLRAPLITYSPSGAPACTGVEDVDAGHTTTARFYSLKVLTWINVFTALHQ
jgi:hypothetical protein